MDRHGCASDSTTGPSVILRVAPTSVRVGGHIAVAADAADDDPTDHLTYLWTATAGSLANATASDTTYTCAGAAAAGPQNITVAVSDGKCTVTRTVSVSCLALSDAGPSPGPDTRGAGGLGAAGDGTGGAGGGNAAGGAGGGDAGVLCVGDPSLCGR